MKYNTVIFDLDGTLLNTLEDLTAAFNYALSQYGYPMRTAVDIRCFLGNGIRRLIERSLPVSTSRLQKDQIEHQIKQIIAAFRRYYNIHCQDKTCAYDGVPELLQQLQNAGCKIGIVSNKLDSAVKKLSYTYFSPYVQTAIGETEGIRRKPAPDMVETALTEMHSTKAETIYVGDSEVDIQTAANAGLSCISVAWGFRDIEYLQKKGAVAIADTPQQVYDMIMN